MRRLPHGGLAVVAAAVALGVVVLACVVGIARDPVATTDLPPATPVSTGSPPSQTSSPTPARAPVPDLVGVHPRQAGAILHDAGLEMLVHRTPGRGCKTTRRVVDQAGGGPTQPVQIWVRVNALTCGLTPTLREVATLFIDFARRDVGHVHADAPVDLYVGGRIATTIESPRVDDPDAWQGCPRGLSGWAGRTCPFSAVDPIENLVSYQGGLQITAATPDLPCGPVQRLPRALGGYDRVAISAGSSCTDSFAITSSSTTSNRSSPSTSHGPSLRK